MTKYALVFDVDGVLADTESVIAQATIAMFRELYGAEFVRADFAPFVGTGAVRYVEGPAEKAGVRVDIDKAVARRTELFLELLESGESIAFPGTNDLIAAAQADPEWTLAVATSGPSDKSKASLRAANVPIDAFPAYITGDMVKKLKPHPEIYQTAAKAAGVPPKNCVAVEDSVHGVQSAKAAGMKCIGVTTSFDRAELSEADLVVDSLEEVTMDTLRSLLGV